MDQQPSEPPTPHSVARSESPLFFMDDTPRRQGRRRSTTGEGEETTAPGEEEEEERDKEDHDHSDVDLDADPHMKLMALVAEKRKELEAKEKEEAKKRRRREVDVERDGDDDDDNNGGDNDGEDEDEEEGRDEPAQGEGEDTDDSMDGIIDAYPEHQQQKENPRKKQQRKQPKQPKKPKEPNQPKPRQQRKASKKAIEDMHRETQRIARNMQLTHEATTKKKITMDSFLSRFSRKNQAENKTSQDTGANGQAEVASSPPAATDKESAQVRNEVHDGLSASRPTSGHRDGSSGKEAALDEEEDALPSATDLIDRLKSDPQSFQPQSQPRPSSPSPSKSPGEATQPDPFIVDAGTGQTHFQDHETSSSTKRTNRPKLSETKQVRVRLSRQAVAQHQEEASSDEDLEIVTNPAKARPIAVFERIPYRVQQRQREASGWSKQLRMLAQLPSSPPREPALSADGRGSANMTQKELELTLLKRARQQAAREREERINELKAKGVVLDAPEDRMEVEMEVEDLIEKARQEGKDLKKQEKMAEKAEQKKNNPKYFDDPDEDSEWDGEEEEDEEGDSEEEKDEEGEEQEEQGQGEDRRSEHDAGSGDEAGIDEKVDRAPVAEPVSQSEQSTIPDLGLPKDNAPTMGLSQAFESTLAEGASGDPSGTSKMNGGDAHDNSQNPFVQSSKDKDNKSPSLSLSQAFASTLSDPTASANPMASTTGESQKEQPPDIGSGDNNDVISLSQAFQSTFAEPEKTPGDNNNVSGDDEKKAKEQESLAMLRNMSNPESQRPDVMLPSQESPYQPGLDVFATPAKGTVITDKDYSITPATRSRYSFSQAPPEPTQDQGFVYSPFDQRKRFLSVDHSTQSPLKGDYNDNINVLGTPIPSRSSDNHSLHPSTDAERISETPSRNERNAFDTLRNNLEENKHSKPSKAKSKREGKRFDKNDSKAKEVVDDAALESDDEYAGLGGVSDDSDEDGDELDREMINDDNGEAVDEKQLAAMNAYVAPFLILFCIIAFILRAISSYAMLYPDANLSPTENITVTKTRSKLTSFSTTSRRALFAVDVATREAVMTMTCRILTRTDTLPDGERSNGSLRVCGAICLKQMRSWAQSHMIQRRVPSCGQLKIAWRMKRASISARKRRRMTVLMIMIMMMLRERHRPRNACWIRRLRG